MLRAMATAPKTGQFIILVSDDGALCPVRWMKSEQLAIGGFWQAKHYELADGDYAGWLEVPEDLLVLLEANWPSYIADYIALARKPLVPTGAELPDAEYVDRPTLASALKVSERSLIRWQAYGLPYVEMGGRIRYKPSSVRAWLDSRERRQTPHPIEN